MEKKEANFKNILKLIGDNKKFAAVFVLIACALVMIYSFIMPVSYLTEASLLPPESKSGLSLPGFLSDMSSSMPMLSGIGGGSKSDIYAEILKSRSVAEFVVENAELKKYGMFEQETNASDELLYDQVRDLIQVYVDKSGLILLNCNLATSYFPSSSEKDTVKIIAADILNSAITGLDRVLIDKSISSAKASGDYIQHEITNYRMELDSIENELVAFQKEHNILEIEEQVQAIVQQAIEVGSSMAEAEIQMNLASIEYETSSPTYNMYKSKYQLLKEQYTKIQEGGLMSEDAFSIPLNQVPQLVKEYTALYRNKKILEQVILFLETQKHQEAIQEKRDVPIVQVLDSAVPPPVKYAPKRKTMLIITFFLSAFIALVIIVGRAIYKGRLYIHTV